MEEINYYAIGQRIRKFRKAQGLSQEQLAEQIGISTTHMSHIETGNTKLSLPVLVGISHALHSRADDLLFDVPTGRRQQAQEEIASVLEACGPQQSAILAEIVKSAKTAMDKYN